ncbi:molybdenum cofactor biosynthesis protein [Aureimonas endophytica]|uniref:Molybdenum cofactor biosynthesis protein n=1 Tax=Aureimonas endophytica TaxID=2027858 RepID=A0A916ZEH0_9HYPH|nr:competence/damage-inducible protein A [Aureimonas endophytica]GGD91613.1 molybdenum cofactor biosynthesis protein [Aureimonas endophytica]
MTASPAPTAAMIAIGDEVLSGRTKDKNIGHLAELFTLAGIDLKEARIIGDEPTQIADTVNTLRRAYDIVVTCGGIGPTHDDITADAIGAAFGLPVGEEPEALRRLAASYAERGIEFTEARRRMARMPEGATLIDNPVSVAPGFRVDNVFVLAGVPSIFQAMLDNVLKELPTGVPIVSAALDCRFPEGDIGGPLREIQKSHPGTSIGSYPRFDGTRHSTELVIRSRDAAALEAARQAVAAMLADFEAKSAS